MTISFRVDQLANGKVRARSSNTTVEVEAQDVLELREALVSALRAAHGRDFEARLLLGDDFASRLPPARGQAGRSGGVAPLCSLRSLAAAK